MLAKILTVRLGELCQPAEELEVPDFGLVSDTEGVSDIGGMSDIGG